MERCRQLSDYAQFVSEVRKRLSKKMPLSEAVNEAVEDCIQRGILAEFLSKNRAEVIKVSIYEYDEEKVKRMFKEECMKLGMEQGQTAWNRAGQTDWNRAGQTNWNRTSKSDFSSVYLWKIRRRYRQRNW